MNTDLLGLLDAVTGLRVLVVGDAILDRYTYGRPDRMCREAPVPAVTVESDVEQGGGAANAAVNARALGAVPVLLSALGADADADRLDALLGAYGVATGGLLRVPGRTTPLRQRVLADGQMLLRLNRGEAAPIPGAAADGLIRLLDAELAAADVLLVSDNASGVVTRDLVAGLVARRARGPGTLVVDSRDPAAFRALRATAVKPNYAEALRAAGAADTPCRDRLRRVHDLGGDLLARTGADLVAVTLDAEGALAFRHGRPPVRTYARGGEARSTVGAGDTFAVALALALAAGADTGAAVEFASAAAGTAVAGPGTAVCDAGELRRALRGTTKTAPLEGVAGWRAEAGRRSRRVVFTNGCFDILHGGHVSLLGRAKELGDLLVVGVNSDESVRRLKGAWRPVNPLPERMRVLAALSCVDLVVPFDGDSPSDLIEAVRPHVYVKGADYTLQTLPEAPLVERLGGVVHLLRLVDDTSTTGIIRRIHALATTGPPKRAPEGDG
ncbi:bifunctional protein HldE [Streptosporangium violaceochromogenes]|nr:bifunctional protein HldE [Streptosporangium violaceochromogenes]